ncbi:hypothetical protein DIPPA_61139 [Diplonema papillatum]|nr:hypothetical protein DIPPA_61139 [Diplonema papillatum]
MKEHGPAQKEENEAATQEKLKEEIVVFGRHFRNELEVHAWHRCGRSEVKALDHEDARNASDDTSSHSLGSIFIRLWETGRVGQLMKQHPLEASRFMNKWATGKLKANSADKLLSRREELKLFAPAKDDDHYVQRVRVLLSFVVIKLFAAVSASYFAKGPDVFGLSGGVLTRLKQCLQQKWSSEVSACSNPVDTLYCAPAEEVEVELFAPDAEAVRLPLSACRSLSQLSQDSLSPCSPPTPLSSVRIRKYDFASTPVGDSQDGFSLSRVDSAFSSSSPSNSRDRSWPIVGLRNRDPQPEVVSDVVQWLQLSFIAIDFDAAWIDTEAETDKIATSASPSTVYPFEQLMNTTIVPLFVLTIPKTLEKIYKELEVGVTTSDVLSTALNLRKRLSSATQTWPHTESTCTKLQTAVEAPKKKRKVAAAVPAPGGSSLGVQLELQAISRKNMASKTRFKSLHFSSKLSFTR